MTRDYWASTAPPLPLYERIELLWRLELLRHTPTDEAVWRDLAKQAERVLEYADLQTIWMHHWIGLAFARAGRPGPGPATARSAPGPSRGARQRPLVNAGGVASGGRARDRRGDLATAVRLMAPAVDHIHTMGGGSREQKDIFRDVLMEVHRRLGHVEEVIALAQQRLLANPYHVPSLAALAWAYERKGDAALHRHACRQLVLRAEEVGAAPESPEIQAARGALVS